MPHHKQALHRMQFPKGFEATLCAAEPEVQNPIAMAWDGRGRLWVAECFTYGEAAFDLSLRDRISQRERFERGAGFQPAVQAAAREQSSGRTSL